MGLILGKPQQRGLGANVNVESSQQPILLPMQRPKQQLPLGEHELVERRAWPLLDLIMWDSAAAGVSQKRAWQLYDERSAWVGVTGIEAEEVQLVQQLCKQFGPLLSMSLEELEQVTQHQRDTDGLREWIDIDITLQGFLPVTEWLSENFGDESPSRWALTPSELDAWYARVWFRDSRCAMLFALAWGSAIRAQGRAQFDANCGGGFKRVRTDNR